MVICSNINAQTKKLSLCEIQSDSVIDMLIPQFYQNDFDSTGELINHWSSVCGLYDPQFRAKVLYVISINEYRQAEWDTFLHQNLPYFEQRLSRSRDSSFRKLNLSRGRSEYFGSVPIGEAYDSFSRDQATYLLGYEDLGASERLVLTLLSEDDSGYYEQLKTTNNDSSIIADLYQNRVRRIFEKPEPFFAAGIGMWSPDREASILGDHPALLASFGEWHPKWGWEFDFDLRILKSRDSFNFTKKQLDIYTDEFAGWAVNGFYTRNISNNFKKRLNLKIGGGWDALIVFYEEEESEFANSFSGVIGLEWALDIGHNLHLKLGYNRHFMSYSWRNRTTLSGNAHSLNLSVSRSTDRQQKIETLKYLKFDPFTESVSDLGYEK